MSEPTLTDTERACFRSVDRLIAGSTLEAIAESVVKRVTRAAEEKVFVDAGKYANGWKHIGDCPMRPCTCGLTQFLGHLDSLLRTEVRT